MSVSRRRQNQQKQPNGSTVQALRAELMAMKLGHRKLLGDIERLTWERDEARKELEQREHNDAGH